MIYRVTIETSGEMLPTVVQVLTDSRVTGFRVEPVESPPAQPPAQPRKRQTDSLPRKRSGRAHITAGQQIVLSLVRQHQGETGVVADILRRVVDPEVLSPNTISPALSHLHQIGAVSRERVDGVLRYRAQS